ncbi:agmatinase family protein [Sphingomonas sp. ID1715]|uniref:agmatinase family protein n=1 Tax=Sphingomonas sp. ID1715 TaxID=1656898 RepID=UPI001487C68F|nr:agmatinase family protein [Sphingomonas sp. ID1715]NNM78184.1 agmatinase family protein [Sphingomonas sp. ID1715]
MSIVRLIGLPTDVNSSFLRGPAKAPGHIRAALFSDMGNLATESGRELVQDIAVEDAGDLPLDESSADDPRIEAAVAQACRDGATPILLGGDHAVTYPVLRGIAAVHGPVNILHFDAHPDLYDELGGNRRSHASPFARVMEEGLATRLVQVGIRTLNAHQREQAARFGVEIVPMRDFAAAAVPTPAAPLYISIDLDGLDPACAPGVSHHEPGGLSVRQLLDVLARVNGPIVGGDVVELNPDRDLNGMTAAVAAKLVKELCALA